MEQKIFFFLLFPTMIRFVWLVFLVKGASGSGGVYRYSICVYPLVVVGNISIVGICFPLPEIQHDCLTTEIINIKIEIKI